MATHNVTNIVNCRGSAWTKRANADGSNAERGDRCERDRHDREQRQRALQEQVRERKPIVLIEDRKGQRQRRVMANEFDRPGGFTAMKLTEVQRRDGERRQRRRPERASRTWPSSRDANQWNDKRNERIRQ